MTTGTHTTCSFSDAAGNILELIARHTLPSTGDAPFSAYSLLNISKIGITSDDVPAQIAHLQTLTGAAPYRWNGDSAYWPAS